MKGERYVRQRANSLYIRNPLLREKAMLGQALPLRLRSIFSKN